MKLVEKSLNLKQRQKCLAKESTAGKVVISIDKAKLISPQGSLWVRIKHPNLPTVVKELNY